MTNSTPPALLFDMDGTLVDSTALVEDTWGGFAAVHGLDLTTVLAFAHGRPTAATVHHFLRDPDVADRETARLVAHEEATTEGVREVPGARAVLGGLPPESWAVVTSASRTLARNRMRAAGLPLPGVLVSADDVVRGKPDPEGYLLAANALGVDITSAVVFEDSPAGVRAGRASGARTVVIGALADFDADLERYADFTAPALVTALLGTPARA
ncbi:MULTISPECIES: HAD-IA family hydrolase [Tsukamurella]|nr:MULTISPECIES: HAD-IA family hydrolase [Tsukamurella]